jgi:SAM-dependent methyltransferase
LRRPVQARHRPPKDQSASRLIKKYAAEIAANAPGPIVDVACGYGRNAICLSSNGVPVVCIDNDPIALAFIESLSTGSQEAGLNIRSVDLERHEWPYGTNTLGAIVCVHYVSVVTLVQQFTSSLRPGGYLCIETVNGHGENYLSLPRAGFFDAALADTFHILYFEERHVGPDCSNAVAVKLVARKK